MKSSKETSIVEDVAAEWVVRRDAGMSEEETRELDTWLAADPRHRTAFAEMSSALGFLNSPGESGKAQEVVANVRAWSERRQKAWWRKSVPWAAAGVAAAVAVGLFLSRPSDLPMPASATLLQPEHRILPDGSIIELNADAEIQIDYQPVRRGVRLLRGEAHFAVAKDATRPFVVSVGRVQVQAVGTAFDIRLAAAAVEVLVTEGIVKLKQEPLSNAVAVPDSMLAAGQRAVIATKVPEVIAAVPVTKSEIAEALSWRETRFELSNTPLNEALELFNRRSRVKLSLGDESLGALRVSGIYFADNPDGFARLLESSLDVKAVREGDRILFRRP